jgi:hypothetical protein
MALAALGAFTACGTLRAITTRLGTFCDALVATALGAVCTTATAATTAASAIGATAITTFATFASFFVAHGWLGFFF